MLKITTLISLLMLSTTLLAAQPACLPAVLALSTAPIGTPVTNNTHWPTVSSLPLNEGLAAFWFCRVGEKIKVAEMHGTPQAIAQYGGLNALHLHYRDHRDDALEELMAKGHACADPQAKPSEVDSRADCVAIQPKAGQPKRYLCLNPQVSSPQEITLCKHLINEMTEQWPQ
jgi:hypothetical protein